MAKFEGVQWAPGQMKYGLNEKVFELLEPDSKVFAVSRSIFYSTLLCFEGIRFFCRKTGKGALEVTFLNWHKNLERFRRGISFNISPKEQNIIPSADTLEDLFINMYFKSPRIRPFLEKMADDQAQGYLRPFTVDEEQSMGVTFPGHPTIRAIFSRYENYLGEPFTGVVIHDLVRTVGLNKTGCLKLGINYVMSLKATEKAGALVPGAGAALFLDDRPDLPLRDRQITEWDSSCFILGKKDGTIIKIPESDLILPSVTVQGITAILRHMGVKVEERHVTYGELIDMTKSEELVVTASIGTAGIMNRAQKLICTDEKNAPIAIHKPDVKHPLYAKLAEVKAYYWNIYKGQAALPAGMDLYKYSL